MFSMSVCEPAALANALSYNSKPLLIEYPLPPLIVTVPEPGVSSIAPRTRNWKSLIRCLENVIVSDLPLAESTSAAATAERREIRPFASAGLLVPTAAWAESTESVTTKAAGIQRSSNASSRGWNVRRGPRCRRSRCRVSHQFFSERSMIGLLVRVFEVLETTSQQGKLRNPARGLPEF